MARAVAGLFAAVLASCNSIAGIHDPIYDESVGAAGSSGTSGTGTSTSGAPAAPSDFAGTWGVSQGTDTFASCNNRAYEGSASATQYTFVVSTKDDGKLRLANGSCGGDLTVDGRSARLAPGVVCAFQLVATGEVGQVQYSSGLFSLGATANQAHLDIAGQAQGANFSCAYNGAFDLVRK